mgnify:CR=1 FL=1
MQLDCNQTSVESTTNGPTWTHGALQKIMLKQSRDQCVQSNVAYNIFPAQVAEIVQQLKDSGVFDVELGPQDILQLMNTMELDLKVSPSFS